MAGEGLGEGVPSTFVGVDVVAEVASGDGDAAEDKGDGAMDALSRGCEAFGSVISDWFIQTRM